MKQITFSVVLLAGVISACQEPHAKSILENTSADSLLVDSIFSEGQALGSIESAELREMSGLVASRRYPGYFWTHNDSGDDPRLFLLDAKGQLMATCFLANAENRDWEDIAWAPGDAADYLYIGEIGDNEAKYTDKFVYRILEPNVNELVVSGGGTLPVEAKYTLHYEDGPRDAEGMFVDPATKELWIISKREERVGIYAFGVPADGEMITGKLMGRLGLKQVTAADISTDGAEILIKTYDFVFYWQRMTGETIVEALSRTPTRLPYHPEPQGESVAWKPDGKGYYTVSEVRHGITPVFYVYHRRP